LQATTVRIGTRGSPLALAQAAEVRTRLDKAHGPGRHVTDIRVIKTTGDRIQDRPLSEAGGKGLFTKELEEALLAGEIDLAVHSMKDMPTLLPAGLTIACLLPREDVRDAFISRKASSLAALPAGAVVATSSLRRQAQVLHLRPDLKVVPMRGNVETRLRKLEDGVADATLLACAGLRRLGLADRITSAIATDEMLPAVAQGAIGVEMRSGNMLMAELLAPINDEPTALAVTAERPFWLGWKAPVAHRLLACRARRRPPGVPRHDPHAGWPRGSRDAPRRPPRGGVAAGRGRRHRVAGPRWPQFSWCSLGRALDCDQPRLPLSTSWSNRRQLTVGPVR
jgi:hydroxymethylbilane synthase